MNGVAHLLAVILLSGFVSQAESETGGPTISESRARAIAWSAGLVHVEEIIRAGDRWELAGRTVDDDEIILDIDVEDGRILN
ncbi:hypothetical protein ACXIUS_16060 [Bosea thiooxidans]|nr:hypothetical protein [Bosea sp. (in: a-proteobacteria)]